MVFFLEYLKINSTEVYYIEYSYYFLFKYKHFYGNFLEYQKTKNKNLEYF